MPTSPQRVQAAELDVGLNSPLGCSAKLVWSLSIRLRSAAAPAGAPLTTTRDACAAFFDALLAMTCASSSDISG